MRKFSKIYESIWSDMQDRGTRDINKTEDVVLINNFSPKMMYEYLIERYKSLRSGNVVNYTASGMTHYIRVHITENCSVEVTYEVRKETTIKELKVWFANFFVDDDVIRMNQKMKDELVKRYITEEEIYVFIRPKTGKRTNMVIIDLIDFILNNIEDKPVIAKR